MREGLSECRTMASQIVQPYFLALLAEAYAKAGQSEEGLTVMAEAMAGVRQRGDRFYEAELHRLKGELLLALSAENRAEAEGCFRQSIEVARQQGAKSLELRAVMSFCRLLQQQGRSEEGRQMLSEVYNWFTEGFDTLDLVEAKELLEELAH